MFSSAVSIGSRLNDWKMNPTLSRRRVVSLASGRFEISIPARNTCPEVMRSKPARQCMRVDLPDPDGPMIAVKVPRVKRTLIEFRAVTRVSPSPKILVSCMPAAASVSMGVLRSPGARPPRWAGVAVLKGWAGKGLAVWGG